MAVIVVRTIAAGYASSGSAALDDALHGDPLWVVGEAGFHYDPALGALLPAGPADASETCSRPCSGRCNESRESKRTIDACGRCSACTRRDFG